MIVGKYFRLSKFFNMTIFSQGTNKSGSLKAVLKAFEEFESIKNTQGQFESGTLEGLMKNLEENGGSSIGIFDEFATFKDSLDKGKSGTAEKGRFLSLFNASNWKKTTQGSGLKSIEDPRFNLISYTQPTYACNFSRNNTTDGFFQRFLLTLPGTGISFHKY